MSQDQEAHPEWQESGGPKNFTQTDGNKTKQWQTTYDNVYSHWEHSSVFFSAGASTKPPPAPLKAGIEGFTPKIEPFSVSHHFCEQV